MSKNQWILKFSAVFLDFLIFSILDGFEMLWLWISNPWLDFLPGAASKSIWARIFIIFRFFCSYVVHVPSLNCQDLADYASAGALALHARIFLHNFHLSIMNLALLRQWKIVNQKYFSYSVRVPSQSGRINCQRIRIQTPDLDRTMPQCLAQVGNLISKQTNCQTLRTFHLDHLAVF